LLLVLIFLFVAALIGASALGGISFSAEAARPKLSRMNPASGLKRMIGKQSAVELVKSILKVTLVAGVAYYLMYSSLEGFF
ncbi:EscU/YscU/HrcU family type III secretion system export apparatus switch protein, partial [Halomonas sp. SIMBA_159]